MMENQTNEISSSKDGGGISNKSQSVSLGIAYTF
jgi:outer membrane protease